MALQKIIISDSGVEVSYWNIAAYNQSIKGKNGEIILEGFLSESARRDGKTSLRSWNTLISGDNYHKDMTLRDLYLILKTLPEWQDADNC